MYDVMLSRMFHFADVQWYKIADTEEKWIEEYASKNNVKLVIDKCDDVSLFKLYRLTFKTERAGKIFMTKHNKKFCPWHEKSLEEKRKYMKKWHNNSLNPCYTNIPKPKHLPRY